MDWANGFLTAAFPALHGDGFGKSTASGSVGFFPRVFCSPIQLTAGFVSPHATFCPRFLLSLSLPTPRASTPHRLGVHTDQRRGWAMSHYRRLDEPDSGASDNGGPFGLIHQKACMAWMIPRSRHGHGMEFLGRAAAFTVEMRRLDRLRGIHIISWSLQEMEGHSARKGSAQYGRNVILRH
jgi:hypothetical protein